MSELPLSRRAVTRAFLAAPIAVASMPAMASVTTAGPGARGEWDAALLRVQRANANYLTAVDAHYAAESTWMDACPPKPHFALKPMESLQEADLRLAAMQKEHEHAKASLKETFQVERLGDASHEALEVLSAELDHLIELPAPDHAAVIKKLELSAEHDLEYSAYDAIIADLRRFGGVA